MGDGMVSVDCHYPVAGRQVGEASFCLTALCQNKSYNVFVLKTLTATE